METNQRVALTSDVWSSGASHDYIGICCHYIDKNWNIEKRIIGFREALARFIAVQGLELNFADTLHWEELIRKSFYANYQHPSRTTTRANLVKWYEWKRTELIGGSVETNQRLALTSDYGRVGRHPTTSAFVVTILIRIGTSRRESLGSDSWMKSTEEK